MHSADPLAPSAAPLGGDRTGAGGGRARDGAAGRRADADARPARATIPARVALACLLAIAFALPLVPTELTPGGVKHVAFLALGAAGLLALWVDAVRGASSPALGTPTDLALGALLAAAVPAALLAQEPGMARYTAGAVAALGALYLLALKTARSPREVRLVLGAAFAAGVVVAADGLVGLARFVTSGATEADRRALLSTRFFAHSYLAAQYLVVVLAGAVVLCVRGGLAPRLRGVLAAGSTVIGAYLVVVGSRGAYLALAAGLATWLLLEHRTRRGGPGALRLGLRALFFLGLMVAVAAGLALAVAALSSDATAGAPARGLSVAFDPAARPVSTARLALWGDTLAMAADHVVTGVGPGNYDLVLPRYHVGPVRVSHAHNQFLHVLAELGLLGLLALLALVKVAVHAARKGAWALAGDAERRPLLLAGVAGLAAALVHGLFETPLAWVEAGSLVMILLAVVTRAGCTSRERRPSPVAAWCGLALLAALVAIVAPSWTRWARASALAADHAPRLAAAVAARARGEVATAERLLDELLARLERADALFPHRDDFAALRAEALQRFGRYEESLAARRIADARVPGTFEHNSAIGNLLMELERPQAAIDPLRRAILAHRGLESVDTYLRLGQAYAAARRHEEAWLVFDDLMQRHPYAEQRPVILKEAAWTLVHLGRELNTARVLLERYETLVPDDADPELPALRRHITGMLDKPRDERRR